MTTFDRRIREAFRQELDHSPAHPDFVRAAAAQVRNGRGVRRAPRAPRLAAVVTPPLAAVVAVCLTLVVVVVLEHTGPRGGLYPAAPAPGYPDVSPSIPGAQLPDARSRAGMAWDAARGEMVLFGGVPQEFGDGFALGNTWTFDLQGWHRRSPALSPPPSAIVLMAYDSAHQEVVVYVPNFAGCNSATMWTWDGSTWTPHPTAGPAPGRASAMAYDPALGQLLLVGTSRCNLDSSETWTWDGRAWTQLHPGGSTPPVGILGGLAYDATNGSMVFADERLSLWRFDGRQWSRIVPLGPNTPQARDGAVIVSLGSGQWLVFGGVALGREGLVGLNDTWTFDGRSWSQRTRAVAPSPRSAAAGAYDPVHHRVVVFGGIAGGHGTTMLNDTWVWDGHWSVA